MREIKTTYGRTYQPFEQTTIEDGVVVDVKREGFYIEAKSQRIITSGNAVILFLDDGTKAVAKCMSDDYYDETKGIKIAYIRAKVKSLLKELKQLTK